MIFYRRPTTRLLTNTELLECLCSVTVTLMTSFQPEKMPVENTRRSRVLSGICPVEMASWMFLSQYRDTKVIFYLFYKITKEFPSFRKVIHICVLQYKMKKASTCLCTVRENEARPTKACVGLAMFYNSFETLKAHDTRNFCNVSWALSVFEV